MRRKTTRKSRRLARTPPHRRPAPRRRYAERLERRDLLSGTQYTASLLDDLSTLPAAANPTAIVDAGNTVFFSALAPGHQTQLWAENVSGTGTATLLQSYTDTAESNGVDTPSIGNMTAQGSRLFYTVSATDSTGAPKTELWVSDAADTKMLGDISGFGGIVSAAGGVFFTAFSGTQESLWFSDGTSVSMLQSFDGGIYIYMFVSDGILYFTAGSSEIWKSDGTRDGTVVVHKFTGNGADIGATAVQPGFAESQGFVYFFATDVDGSRNSLWRTDGGGTERVADLPGVANSNNGFPLPALSDPYGLIAVGNSLYFFTQYYGVVSEPETALWSSQGTPTTTTELVAQVAFDPRQNVSPGGMAFAFGGTLFVSGFADGVEPGLWRLDGSSLDQVAGGTVNQAPLTTIVPAADGTIYLAGSSFDQTSNSSVYQLWKTDGTAAGTVLVTNLLDGGEPGIAANFTAVGGSVFFTKNTSSGGGLWKSDGSAAGTLLVTSVAAPELGVESISAPLVLGNRAVFTDTVTDTVGNSNTSDSSTSLWATDGTHGGTISLLSGPTPTGGGSGGIGVVAPPVMSGSDAVFYYFDGKKEQLWTTDGTPAGTQMLTPSTESVSPLTTIGSSTYFGVWQPDFSQQVWQTDGTPTGSKAIHYASNGQVLQFPFLGIPPTFYSIGAQTLVWVDGSVYSLVNGELTSLPIPAGSLFSKAFPVGGRLFLKVDTASGDDLYATDGTATGSVLLAKAVPNFTSGSTVGGKVLLFAEGTPTSSAELWATDGTQAETARLQTFSGTVGSTVALSSEAVFSVSTSSGDQLWASDGRGATELQQFSGTISGLVVTGNTTVFGVHTTMGDQLWTSDGTIGGTTKLLDLTLLAVDASGAATPGFDTVSASGQLYFVADDGTDGAQVWATDATAMGTHELTDINPANGDQSPPTGLTYLNGTLFFFADDGVHGYEPWSSDGTPSGTTLLADVNPGSYPSGPQGFTNQAPTGTVASAAFASVNGSVVFPANDGFHAIEPWILTPSGPAAISALGDGILAATEGANLTATLATFTDPNGAGSSGDYSATVDWGDGSATGFATVSGPDDKGVFTVSGSHKYAEETASPDTIRVVVARTGSPNATVTDSVNVGDAPLTVTGATLTTQVNAALTGAIATFTDPGGAEPLADYSATVDWGDGSGTSPATISGPDANGVFTISGSHTYAAAGTPTITVRLHHDAISPDATVNDPVTVSGGPAAVVVHNAGNLAATEGASANWLLATFTDPSGTGAPSQYSASVDWGDGSTPGAATISGPDANSVFTVSSSHTYAEEAAAPETIRVVVARTGSPNATAVDTVNVADAPLSVTGKTLTAQANASFTGAIATFTDSGGAEPLSDYSVTVDWGDGSGTSPGTISGPDANGVFTVSGSHTYTAAGTPTITVRLHHDAVTPDVTVSDAVTVAPPLLTGGALTISMYADQTGIEAGQTAGFTITVSNDGPNAAEGVSLVDSLPDLYDGVEYDNLNWQIDTSGNDPQGAQNLQPGDFVISGGSLVLAPSVSTLFAGELISVRIVAQTAGYTGTILNIASIADDDTKQGSVEAAAEIGVNNGSAVAPFLLPSDNYNFALGNENGSGALYDTATLVNYDDPPNGPLPLTPPAGVTFYLFPPGTAANTTGTGAVYTETAPLNSDLAETGTGTSNGSAVPTESGIYTWEAIYGGLGPTDEPPSVGFTYVTVGSPAPVVEVSADGEDASGKEPTVIVGEGQSMTASARLLNAFNPSGTITFYLENYYSGDIYYSDSVTVNGDGTYTTAAGTNAGGYVPTAPGPYEWRVVYSGDAENPSVSGLSGPVYPLVGANVVLTSSVNPSMLYQPVTFTATVTAIDGEALSAADGSVEFEDSGNPISGPGVIGPFNTTSNGTSYQVSLIASSLPVGTNSIQAIYTPADSPLNYFAGGKSNVVEQEVNVSPGLSEVSAAGAGTLAATEGASLAKTLATFTDPNGAGALAQYSATVDWGDGSTPGAVTISGPDANGVFTVSGTHTYAEETSAPDTINVVITRTDSPDATVADSVNVADAPLSVTGTSLSAQVNTGLTGAVATFTDPGGAEALADYSATVDWGDGSNTSPATITGPDANGVFTISGGHTYTAAGTPTATVTLHHDAVTPDAKIQDAVSIAGPLVYASPGGNVSVRLVNGNVEIVSGSNVAASLPLDLVTSVTVNGADGVANNFTLDYSNGTFVVPGGITFNGGALPATPSNSLTITGGTFDTDTFDFTSSHDGSIQLGTGGQVVNYTNMTPLANTGTAANAVFKLPDGTVVAALDAGATSGTVELVSGNGAFESTTIPAPSGSLTVNAGSGSDTVTTTSKFYNNFSGNLTVSGAANTLPVHAIGIGTIAATAGTALTGTVATFSDPNGAASSGDYSAMIDWGDGTSATAGSISGPDGQGSFTVTGAHIYTEAGAAAETLKVTVHRANATDASVIDTVNVAAEGTPHERLVTALYQDLLGRMPEPGGLAFWAQQLDAGTPASNIVGDIAHSAEYFAKEVIEPEYLKLLSRAADAAGLAGWTTAMQNGLTDQQLEADFLASNEFYNHAGGTDVDWLNAVYKLLLGRAVEPSGLTYWTGQLAQGQTRAQVAEQIANSSENNSQLIGDDYFHYLGRAADTNDLAFWLQKLVNGTTNEEAIAEITSSPEYYQHRLS